MNEHWRKIAEEVGHKILSEDEFEEFKKIPFFDEGHGYDLFGYERESFMFAYAFGKFLYEKYFRVESFGHENIPKEGKGMIVVNHSGVIPLDGAMLVGDCLKKLDPPRLVRSVVLRFFMGYPFIGTILRRIGQVNGMKRDFEELLRRGELTAVFPEGVRGLGKHFSKRYKLQQFNVGFMEIAIEEQAPIIPTCVIGAEEQAPMLLNIKPIAKILGFPYFPMTPTFPLLGPLGAIPLPVRYRIYYGEPMYFYKDYPPETVNNPAKIRELVETVRGKIQDMINKGLEERAGIFV